MSLKVSTSECEGSENKNIEPMREKTVPELEARLTYQPRSLPLTRSLNKSVGK